MESNPIINEFLRETYKENLSIYEESLSSAAAPHWDVVVVTATNEKQADMYRLLMEDRKANGCLPCGTEFLVLADRDDKRIGSGGATLGALSHILEKYGMGPMLEKRLLIIHSGGDAKRIPQYGQMGKLFTPIPRLVAGHDASTLFDELLISLSGVPSRMQCGCLVVSGDMLYIFNHTQIDLMSDGIICFSMKESVQKGTHHGVFVAGEGNRVEHFLHKRSKAELAASHAIDPYGAIDLDIGLTYMGTPLILTLLRLISQDDIILPSMVERYINERLCLNFYSDFIYPMALQTTLEDYLQELGEKASSDELLRCRKTLYEELRKHSMSMYSFAPGLTLSVGTTRELLEMDRYVGESYPLQWQRDILTTRNSDSGMILLCDISKNARIGNNVYMHECRIGRDVTIGNECSLSGCDLDGNVQLNDRTVLHVLATDEGYVTRLYGVDDNPKMAEMLGRPLMDYMTANGISEHDLWHEGEDQNLWNARLYPACSTQQESIVWALRLQDGIGNHVAAWRLCLRHNLADGMPHFAISKTLARKQVLADEIRSKSFIETLLGGTHVQDLVQRFGNTSVAQRCLKMMEEWLQQGGYPRWHDAMRIYIGCAEVATAYGLPHSALLEAGYTALRQASSVEPSRERMTLAQHVCCKDMPVRVNWGGGWSDAPPYCFEHGGTMLNAAVSMGGALPIHIEVEALNSEVVELESVDLNTRRTVTQLQALTEYKNPADPLTLPKAALFACGLLREDSDEPLEVQLRKLGGGIRISTTVSVPKGSGLGTSSILAGGVIQALLGLCDVKPSDKDLFNSVLRLEQMLTTGGGWQDQIGGLLSGIKFTQTHPGIPQKYDIETVKLLPETMMQLNRRGFLLYTGQRRLAKTVLRRVVTNYVLNNPQSLKALEETRRLAVIMKYELQRDNVKAFASLLDAQMKLNIMLDPGSTNTFIETLMQCCRPFVDGMSICGAGGGGYLYGLLREGVSHVDLQEHLSSLFNGIGIALCDCELYTP